MIAASDSVFYKFWLQQYVLSLKNDYLEELCLGSRIKHIHPWYTSIISSLKRAKLYLKS